MLHSSFRTAHVLSFSLSLSTRYVSLVHADDLADAVSADDDARAPSAAHPAESSARHANTLELLVLDGHTVATLDQHDSSQRDAQATGASSSSSFVVFDDNNRDHGEQSRLDFSFTHARSNASVSSVRYVASNSNTCKVTPDSHRITSVLSLSLHRCRTV